jgi:hypothetical protein
MYVIAVCALGSNPASFVARHREKETINEGVVFRRRMTGLTLEELKKRMAEFAKERDWDQFHSPRNLLLALVITFFHL